MSGSPHRSSPEPYTTTRPDYWVEQAAEKDREREGGREGGRKREREREKLRGRVPR